MSQQVAVITGAGSGVGRAVARELASTGWRLALVGRRAEPLAETAAGLDPERALVLPADVTDEPQVEAVFDAAAAQFGRIDLLFNNAGRFGPSAPVEEVAAADWRAVVDVNLTGAFLCARAAFRRMKDQRPQGGRIVNNGSISAHVPRPHAIAYTATKHAITGLTRALSLEGRPYRIACGQLDIGNAATDMTAAMSAGVRQADGRVAPEPTMDVADVARTVRHMAELPLEANVQFATVMATAMPYIGRG
ncbi:SDR family oxidoreductase [Streptomyces sp. TLI_171]|uniref:SDR family oxidoreductase n=1 Tax=Streptomyces sp. TLI_171 TaxID=1938859 RepID=UPI000C42B658|nr:NADP-dependent 3-hydroxy acid dehydrogenase YdfG [Streptomyces sp. TLI_171]